MDIQNEVIYVYYILNTHTHMHARTHPYTHIQIYINTIILNNFIIIIEIRFLVAV